MAAAKQLSDAAKRLRRSYGMLGFTPRRLAGPIRVAVVGTGKAARYHLEALEKIRGVEVACLVHRGGSDPSALMKRHGIPRCHVGVGASLAQRDFDAAILAVSEPASCEVAAAYLEAGVHSLIEKPLGETLEEAAALRACAARSTATSAVGFNRRCYSAVRAAEECVDALGDPYAIHVDSPERFDAVRRAGEAPEATRLRLVTNTCHAIDLFTVFAGEHEAVVPGGSVRTFEGIPVDYSAMIRFRKGQSGVFTSHWSSPGDRVATLYGRDYKLAIDLTHDELTVTRKKKVRRIRRARVDWIFKAGVYLQDGEFLAAALAGAPVSRPLASVEEAFQTQRLAYALLESAGIEVSHRGEGSPRS